MRKKEELKIEEREQICLNNFYFFCCCLVWWERYCVWFFFCGVRTMINMFIRQTTVNFVSDE